MRSDITAITLLDLKSAIARDPLIVSPDMTVAAASARISSVQTCCQAFQPTSTQDDRDLEAQSSCVLVVENRKVVGVLTARDILRLSLQPEPLDSLAVRQVMTQPIVTLRESDATDIDDAIDLLQPQHIHYLPIVDEHDYPVGVVTCSYLRHIALKNQLLRSQQREAIVADITLRIRQHTGSDAIANAIVQNVRECLTADRVIVYRFNSDRSGTIVSESIASPWSTCLNVQVTDTCVQENLGGDDQQGRISTISDIYTANLSDCYRELLEQFQVRANLVVPIVLSDDAAHPLWGLLIAHQCSGPRQWEEDDIRLLQQLSVQLAIALQQADLYQSLHDLNTSLEQKVEDRTRELGMLANQEHVLTTIATQIRSSLDLHVILDRTVREIRALLQCNRVNIWQFDTDWQLTVVAESTDSTLSLIGEQLEDPCFTQGGIEPYLRGHIHVVPDIHTATMSDCHRQMLIRLQTRSKILVPLLCGSKLWGLLNVSESHHPRDWQPEEVNLLQALSVQLAIALQQATTHQHLHAELIERQQAETRLQKSEQRYATLAASAPVGIMRGDATGNCTYVNERYCQITGLSPDESMDRKWQQGLHPDDRDWVIAEWEDAIQQKRSSEIECRYQRPDGGVRWIHAECVPEWDGNRQLVGYVGTITDLSARKSAEAQLEEKNALLAKIANNEPLADVLRALIESLEHHLNGALCSVLLLDQDNRLCLGAAPNLPPEYNQAIDGIIIGDAVGSCGTAAFRQETIIVSDIAHDPLWQDYKELALTHGLRACWSSPVVARDGQVLGTFAVYYLDVRSPQPQELESIAQMAYIASIAIKHQHVEDALRESEARWQFALEGAGDGVWDWNLQTNRVFYSQQWKAMLGYANHEVGDRPEDWEALIHPDDRDHCRRELTKHLSNETSEYHNEFQMRCKDGRYKWILTRGRLIERTADGQPLRMIGTHADISDRKQAELALQQSEAQSRAILTAIPDFMFRVGSDGTYRGFATQYRDYDAVPHEVERIGRTLADVLPADLANRHMHYLKQALQTGKMQVYEQELYVTVGQGQDETKRLQHEEVRVVQSGYDEVLFMIRDIGDRKQLEAERKRTEIALRESEQRFRTLFESTPNIAVQGYNRHRRVIYWNEASEQLYGYPEVEAIGQYLEDLIIPPEMRQWAIDAVEAWLMDGQSIPAGELTLIRKDGSRVVVFSSHIMLTNSEGEQEMYCVDIDLSDRKQAETALIQSEEKSRALLAAMPDLVFRVSTDGIFREFVANKPDINLLSSDDNPVGLAITDILPTELATRHCDHLEKTLRTGNLQIYEQQVPIGERLQYEEVRMVKSGDDEILCIIRDISDRKQAEAALQNLIAGTAATTGEDFFPALVSHLAQTLNVTYAAVTEQVNGTLKTLAVWVNGALQSPFSYSMAKTPCEQTLQHGKFYCECSIQQQFPDNSDLATMEAESYLGIALQGTDGKAIGSLCVLDRQPIQNPQWAEQILRVFAARASAELERQRATTLLENLNQELENKVKERTAELCISEAKVRTIIEAIPDLLLRVSRDGTCLDYMQSRNQNGEFLPIHENLSEVLPPALLQQQLEAIERAIATGTLQIYEHHFQKHDRTVYEEVRISALSNDDVLIIVRDVTDRKQAELALIQSEAKSRAILAALPDLMFRVGVDGAYREFVTGQSKREVFFAGRDPIGSLMIDMIPVNLASKKLAYMEKALRTQKLQVYEQQIQMNGQIRHEEVRVVKSGDDEVLFIIRDITDRKETEAALQASENRYRAIFNQVAVGINQANSSGQFISANQAFCEMLGYTEAELLQLSYRDITYPEDTAQHEEKYKNLIAEQGSFYMYDKRYRHKAGHYIWVEITISILRDRNNQFLSDVAVVVNIDDRKKAEMQLKQTNEELARATRLKDEFLANMSHELRTPLNAILGMTEGLQEQVFGSINERQLKALQTVEQSSTHLLELINDILDVAKIESGQMQLNCSPTAIVPLCQSSLSFIKQQALKKRIQLETQFPSNLPDGYIDERYIRQVLINLLTNAVKFTPNGGHITLKVSVLASAVDSETVTTTHVAADANTVSSPNHLRIEVMDTGIGIAEDDIPKLFQPFVQIDSALNRKYQGTGLGLALVKRIVELHDGHVGLTSQVGGGSCFTVDLPYVAAAFSSATLDAPSESMANVSDSAASVSPVILLAEDNEANINTISSYLSARGYRLILANDGHEAIALAQSEHPDLILMDIQMPEMDGLEAMQHIRQDPMLVDVPIIALTALAMTGDRERCLASGATDYLSKPVKLRELATTIQRLLIPQEDEHQILHDD